MERDVGLAELTDIFSYSDFRDGIYTDIIKKNNKIDKIDPLLVWTQIRSFIKGSKDVIEYWSGQEGGVCQDRQTFYLPRDVYVENDEKFSAKRCRLNRDRKSIIYDVFFTKYQSMLEEEGKWDAMDRVMRILKRLDLLERSDWSADNDTVKNSPYRVDRLYVDGYLHINTDL